VARTTKSGAEPENQPEPGAHLRKVLRWLWYPYILLIYTPFFCIFTVACGVVAVLLCKLSPRAAHHVANIWAWTLCRLAPIWVQINGREHLQPGQSYVLMSNHQSLYDVMAFYGHYWRQFRWVMKEQLRKVPGIGWYCSAGGHVFIDRSSQEKSLRSLQMAKQVLADGISVMFFPEGNRSNNGRMLPFKSGGFHVAQELGMPILPISISGSRHVLPKNSSRLLPGIIRIRFHPPIEVKDYPAAERRRLIADVRARIASGLSDWEREGE